VANHLENLEKEFDIGQEKVREIRKSHPSVLVSELMVFIVIALLSIGFVKVPSW